MATAFKDELDDLPSTPKAATATAKVTVEDDDDKAGMKPASAAASEEVEDLAVDFGDKELMKRGDGLDRVRPEKGKAVRFALLTEFLKAQMAYTHFIDKKGTYRCLVDKIRRTSPKKCVSCSGVVIVDELHPTKTCKCATPLLGNPDATGYCCKKLGESSEPTIVALVVHYTNADPKEGGYEKGASIDWAIGYVQLTKANFQAISRLPEEEQAVHNIDVVMMHANRAFGYEFHKKSSRPRWKANPELMAEVKERLKPLLDGKKVGMRLGRKVSELEMKALIASLGPGAEDAKLGDVENL
jgi:hypothetical protein